MASSVSIFSFFFFNDTATTEIYTLSLHDALPICFDHCPYFLPYGVYWTLSYNSETPALGRGRSEEHTSELQSRLHLVCRLLLEKKKDMHFLIAHLTPVYLETRCSYSFTVDFT